MKAAGHTTVHGLAHDPSLKYRLVSSNMPGVTLTQNGTLTIPGCDGDSSDLGKVRKILIEAENECKAKSQKVIHVEFRSTETVPVWTIGVMAALGCACLILAIASIVLGIRYCSLR